MTMATVMIMAIIMAIMVMATVMVMDFKGKNNMEPKIMGTLDMGTKVSSNQDQCITNLLHMVAEVVMEDMTLTKI